MAWADEIQKTSNYLSDIGGVVNQGLDIFNRTKETFFPYDTGTIGRETVPDTSPTPEPVTLTPQSSPLGGIDSKVLIVGAVIIGLFFISRK